MTMDDLLDQLLVYSYQLYKLNVKQAAGDYDYFVTWLRSVDPINNDKHFGVVPAGENTVAPLANNCPIPYTPSKEIVKDCLNKNMAACIFTYITSILSQMDSYVTGDEVGALEEYKLYTSKLRSFLDD